MRKRCSKCDILKGVNEFAKDKTHKDGLKSVCKECLLVYYERNKETICERCRGYYKRNKEVVNKRQKRYREKNRGAHNEYNRRYQREKRELLNEYNRRYHKKNKDALNRYLRLYRKRNKAALKEKRRLYLKTENGKAAGRRGGNKRRAKRKDAVADLTVEQWKYIVKKQKSRCNVCGIKFNKGHLPTQDHIIPVSKGGNYSSENIQALCRSCNPRKHAKLDYQYIQAWLKIDQIYI